MIFNTVFVIWALHIIANFIFFKKNRLKKFQAGCIIWVGFALIHVLNAIYFAPTIADMMATKSEMADARWSQSPGFDNPFTLFVAGFVGSILIQIIFNSGIKSDKNGMPDTYGN